MKKHLLMILVAAAFGCEGKAKESKPAASSETETQARESKEATRSKEEPKAEVKADPKEDADESQPTGDSEADGAADAAAESEDEYAPCQTKFSAEETRDRAKYLEQCTQALARATACISDSAFAKALSAVEKGWGPNAKTALKHAKEAFGTQKAAAQLCQEMQRDLSCEAAARDWGNAWEAGSFDEVLGAPEWKCAAVAAAMPERPVRAD